MTLPISECATQTKVKYRRLSSIEDQFHPLGRWSYFSQKHSETAPNSISSVLVKCTKTEYFSHATTLQAIFRAVKHVRKLFIMFLISKFIFFFELIKFYVFFYQK